MVVDFLIYCGLGPCHFEASEDTMTESNQLLKSWWGGNPPSLIPPLWNIGILLSKRAKLRTFMQTTVSLETA